MDDRAAAKNVLIRAKKSREKLDESICAFKEFLSGEAPNLPKYYLARNRLQEGQALLTEVLNDAKKLLGPLPDYVSENLKETRGKLLRESHVVLESRTIDALEKELLADEDVKSFMDSGKVVHYVREAGTYQTAGKRKIQNIKIRMIIDELGALAVEGRELQRRAGEKIMPK